MKKNPIILLLILLLFACFSIKKKKIRMSAIILTNKSDAERVLDKLNSGANFSQLATKYSIGPERKNNGPFINELG